jgi:uncharacterized membrane protein YqiK
MNHEELILNVARAADAHTAAAEALEAAGMAECERRRALSSAKQELRAAIEDQVSAARLCSDPSWSAHLSDNPAAERTITQS